MVSNLPSLMACTAFTISSLLPGSTNCTVPYTTSGTDATFVVIKGFHKAHTSLIANPNPSARVGNITTSLAPIRCLSSSLGHDSIHTT